MLICQFLGTGAAEGVPAPCCRCEACEDARKNPAHQRLRSSFRVSEKMTIDLGADAVTQAIKYGDFNEAEHILITHTHDDHLNPHMMMQAAWCKEQRKTLHYYFTDKAYDIVDLWKNSPWILKGKVALWEQEGIVQFHKLEYGVRYEIDGIGVTPFEGNHTGNVGEHSAMYLLELPDGRKLFYGLDSGEYFEHTLDELKKHKIDIYISEASIGTCLEYGGKGHLDIYGVKKLADILFNQGSIDENTQMYLSHISHRTSHTDMLKAVEELDFPIKTYVAVDGMKIL